MERINQHSLSSRLRKSNIKNKAEEGSKKAYFDSSPTSPTQNLHYPRLSPPIFSMKLFFILCLFSLLLIMQDFSEALSLSNADISMGGENTAAALYRKHYRPTFNCKYGCSRRCSKASRKKRCLRACMACCSRCHCVPPGTYGNKEVCPCYARLKTHGNRPKCP